MIHSASDQYMDQGEQKLKPTACSINNGIMYIAKSGHTNLYPLTDVLHCNNTVQRSFPAILWFIYGIPS